MSPPKDMKATLLLNIWVKAECTLKRKTGVFQKHPWGPICFSGYYKRSKVAFNNQESIVPQGCYGTPHF